jgi:hypothetical protein
MRGDPRFVAGFVPELDIAIWIPRAATSAEASDLSRRIFEECARRGLHLALADLPVEFFGPDSGLTRDRPTVTCLRSVLMKPEHEDWVERIADIVAAAAAAAPGRGGS